MHRLVIVTNPSDECIFMISSEDLMDSDCHYLRGWAAMESHKKELVTFYDPGSMQLILRTETLGFLDETIPPLDLETLLSWAELCVSETLLLRLVWNQNRKMDFKIKGRRIGIVGTSGKWIHNTSLCL